MTLWIRRNFFILSNLVFIRTTLLIISLTEHIRQLLDKGEYVCGIFVDLEKAFDTMSHDILCKKLWSQGEHEQFNTIISSK